MLRQVVIYSLIAPPRVKLFVILLMKLVMARILLVSMTATPHKSTHNEGDQSDDSPDVYHPNGCMINIEATCMIYDGISNTSCIDFEIPQCKWQLFSLEFSYYGGNFSQSKNNTQTDHDPLVQCQDFHRGPPTDTLSFQLSFIVVTDGERSGVIYFSDF